VRELGIGIGIRETGSGPESATHRGGLGLGQEAAWICAMFDGIVGHGELFDADFTE
jgi:hypothetical protein